MWPGPHLAHLRQYIIVGALSQEPEGEQAVAPRNALPAPEDEHHSVMG